VLPTLRVCRKRSLAAASLQAQIDICLDLDWHAGLHAYCRYLPLLDRFARERTAGNSNRLLAMKQSLECAFVVRHGASATL
jgi:hypothetical protein